MTGVGDWLTCTLCTQYKCKSVSRDGHMYGCGGLIRICGSAFYCVERQKCVRCDNEWRSRSPHFGVEDDYLHNIELACWMNGGDRNVLFVPLMCRIE